MPQKSSPKNTEDDLQFLNDEIGKSNEKKSKEKDEEEKVEYENNDDGVEIQEFKDDDHEIEDNYQKDDGVIQSKRSEVEKEENPNFYGSGGGAPQRSNNYYGSGRGTGGHRYHRDNQYDNSNRNSFRGRGRGYYGGRGRGYRGGYDKPIFDDPEYRK